MRKFSKYPNNRVWRPEFITRSQMRTFSDCDIVFSDELPNNVKNIANQCFSEKAPEYVEASNETVDYLEKFWIEQTKDKECIPSDMVVGGCVPLPDCEFTNTASDGTVGGMSYRVKLFDDYHEIVSNAKEEKSTNDFIGMVIGLLIMNMKFVDRSSSVMIAVPLAFSEAFGISPSHTVILPERQPKAMSSSMLMELKKSLIKDLI